MSVSSPFVAPSPKVRDFDQRLWSLFLAAGPPRRMLDVVENIGVLKGEHLTFETIMCESDPFAAMLPDTQDHYTLTDGHNKVVKVADVDGDFLIACWATEYPGVFHLSGSIPTSDRRWSKVNRWIHRAPDIMRCYLNEDMFRQLGLRLWSIGRPEVRKMTAWRQSDSSSLNRSWPAKTDHERYTPDEVFELAKSEGASVRSLTVTTETGLNCHLRRQSGTTYYSGDFPAYNQQVLEQLATYSASRLALISNRQREASRPLMRPLSISLPEQVFQSAEDTQRLRALLEDQSQISIAVLHSNPYLHLMVSDQVDGSTFDVVVTKPDSVELYPSFRSTGPALARLAQKIGEHFSAANIEEARPKAPVNLSDLLNA